MPRIPGLKRFFRLADARRRVDLSSIDDELRFHVESRVDELIATGVPERDARTQAALEFGDLRRYHDDCVAIDSRYNRELHMRELLESIGSDLKHAARSLRLQPGFAFVAIATLALGIGATTSVFSAVDGVLLRPLAYANANRIVHVGEQDAAPHTRHVRLHEHRRGRVVRTEGGDRRQHGVGVVDDGGGLDGAVRGTRPAPVTPGRRRTHDEGASAVVGDDAPDLDGGRRVVGRPVRREHDAGRDREACGTGGGEVGGLATHPRRVERRWGVQRDDGCGGVHAPMRHGEA